jgi:peptide/nickel transport system substrate-binding protein
MERRRQNPEEGLTDMYQQQTTWRRRTGQRLGRRAVLRTGTLAGAAAFIAACGGSGDDASGTDSAVAPSTREVETSQPKTGGTLRVRLAANPPLDPYSTSQYNSQVLSSYVLARLLKLKSGPSPEVAASYQTEGDLAETVEVPADGLTVTFKLRDNAAWQDVAPVSGRTVDSEDVKLSLERYRTEPRNSNRGVFGTAENPLVESVQTPDPKTVVIKLARPYGPFRNMVANPNFLWIMPKEVNAGAIDPGKQMIGAGPFILDSVEPDIAYKLRRNPNYYGAPTPYIESVDLVRINEVAQEVSQFQAERLDAIAVPAEQLEEVKRSLPRAETIEYLTSNYGFLAFQLRSDTPFKDERVRQAASMSIDRDGLLDLVYLGRGAWNSAVPANFGAWTVNPKSDDIGPGGQWFKFDPAESKKLLAAAGYPDGITIKFVFTNNVYGEIFNQAAEAIAGMLKEGGFNTQVVVQDYQREYISPTGTFFGGNFESVFYGLESLFSDPHDYLFNMFHTRGTRNHSGVRDAQLDAMIDKEGATLDDQERIKQVKDIQRYLAEKMYYGTGVSGAAFIGVQPWVKNYMPVNGGFGVGAETWAKAWLERGG